MTSIMEDLQRLVHPSFDSKLSCCTRMSHAWWVLCISDEPGDFCPLSLAAVWDPAYRTRPHYFSVTGTVAISADHHKSPQRRPSECITSWSLCSHHLKSKKKKFIEKWENYIVRKFICSKMLVKLYSALNSLPASMYQLSCNIYGQV